MQQPSEFYLRGLFPNEAALGFRDLALESKRWSRAEERTAQLIAHIQPNQASEKQRHDIARYVKGLVMKCFPCQVFPTGSVPLKTYLPDGDIDLTALCKNKDFKETWASEVKEILEREEEREDAEFHVKGIKITPGEVKVVKCVVDDISVDITINKPGALCTLCFFDEVDSLISHNHLFKRSIILIKAWCYYESQILGSQYGFLSTYALETLVLYIFLAFNNSFAGPLEVLYRFLEFFGKFDWYNFCVTLCGSVLLHSSIDCNVYPERFHGKESSLGKLIYACISAYSVFPGDFDGERPFRKFLFNIVDPLCKNNNIGRSIHTYENLIKIWLALREGSQKLAGLLDCPEDDVEAELDHFFAKTWHRVQKLHHSDAGPENQIDWSRDFKACSSSEPT